ncbi:carboxypeptidase-like regulatory domain-containing protein [Pedobacter chinensis]|uniref:Carboxypeptidase-like regulatory domain-containing protein n=1 Tax=Pedobacter chinensis TaxID=2282421 RepID=A0A369PVL8_9SPHI|nr:carboxypeptidase-like regulatory domain-containing protein [Pedobacter chinensis]RDC54726.1 carboxypeptidase-like regulatory domain-containing protein [Pedobacter chinensis]
MVSKTVNSTFLILFFLLVSNLTFAQFTITGKILNLIDNKPLESVTVFVNKTSYGTKTDGHGNFTIHNVRPGHYELIVSMISFKTYKVSISVQSDTKLPAIAIEEKTISLSEVKITNTKKLDSKYMDMFKREILGTSKFGKQCRIVNPKVIQLNFDQRENKLTAYTSDFMVIDNNALGYRLKYLVENFERNEKTELISYVGYILFETMEGDDQQRRDWNEKRLEAYTGSLQHFLRSVLGNNINREEELGFLVTTDTRLPNKYRLPDTLIRKKIRMYSGKYSQTDKDSLFFWTNMFQQPRYIEVIDTTKLRAKQIVRLTDQNGLYALQINNDINYINKWGYIKVPGLKGRTNFRCDTCQFKNSLYVTYIKYIPKKLTKTYKSGNSNIEESFVPPPDMDKMASLISILDGNVFFDWNGAIVNPMNLKLERHWANLRLGDLLPIDYLPHTD